MAVRLFSFMFVCLLAYLRIGLLVHRFVCSSVCLYVSVCLRLCVSMFGCLFVCWCDCLFFFFLCAC